MLEQSKKYGDRNDQLLYNSKRAPENLNRQDRYASAILAGELLAHDTTMQRVIITIHHHCIRNSRTRSSCRDRRGGQRRQRDHPKPGEVPSRIRCFVGCRRHAF